MELKEQVEIEKVEKEPKYIIEVHPALHPKAINVIQQGIKIEQDSAQIYEAMSSFLDDIHFENTSNFFKIHAGEERKHSDWVIQFLKDKNVKPILPEISKPNQEFKDLKDVLAKAYEHEELVTNFWNKAATECLKYADHDAYQFCLYILKEQREELALFSGLIDKYNLSKGGSMISFDSKISHP